MQCICLRLVVPFTIAAAICEAMKMVGSGLQRKPGLVDHPNENAKLSLVPSRKQKTNRNKNKERCEKFGFLIWVIYQP